MLVVFNKLNAIQKLFERSQGEIISERLVGFPWVPTFRGLERYGGAEEFEEAIDGRCYPFAETSSKPVVGGERAVGVLGRVGADGVRGVVRGVVEFQG